VTAARHDDQADALAYAALEIASRRRHQHAPGVFAIANESL
jgi:hypothetical protein